MYALKDLWTKSFRDKNAGHHAKEITPLLFFSIFQKKKKRRGITRLRSQPFPPTGPAQQHSTSPSSPCLPLLLPCWPIPPSRLPWRASCCPYSSVSARWRVLARSLRVTSGEYTGSVDRSRDDQSSRPAQWSTFLEGTYRGARLRGGTASPCR